jgi:hypothetical protein
MNMALSMAFGVVFIAGLFLIFAWAKAMIDRRHNHDAKYLVTTAGLTCGTIGVTILAFNRTVNAMFGGDIYPGLLLFAGVVMAASMAALVRGTTMNGFQKQCWAFGILSAAWVGFSAWWWL